MKIFIMVDMEGISGICRKTQVYPDGMHYQAARRYLTWDVNACVEGCIEGGASKVVVRDAHSSGHHFIWEELHPGAEYIQGNSGKERIPDIASFDALILLGYHAMAGVPEAILEHTMNSIKWQNLWINERKSGELALDAGIAGGHNVPTIMASGDDKLCQEAKDFIPEILTAEVKKGLHLEGGILLPKEKAHQLIRETAAEAVKRCKDIKPYKIKSPLKMKLELIERSQVPGKRPDIKVIDGRTYEVSASNVQEALNLLI